jgi:bacteriorhodopsin
MTIITIFSVIPILYTALKIYNKFEDKTLKERWVYFIIGTVGLIIYLYGVYINNLINLPTARFAFSLFGLTVFVWMYLIYYGIGRQIE